MFEGIFHPARDHDAGPGEWCVRSRRSEFELKVAGKLQAHILAAVLNGGPLPEDLIECLRKAEAGQHESELRRPRAPWTADQVALLNDFQASPETFTLKCDYYRDNERHRAYAEQHGGVPGQLIATTEGLSCPVCLYRQDWAHEIMMRGAQPQPFWYFLAPDYSGTDAAHDEADRGENPVHRDRDR